MPVPIICLDEDLCHFAERYRECLSKPQYQYFVIVLLGLMLCEGRRTLSGVVRQVAERSSLAGLSRFLAQTPWDAQAMGEQWMKHFREEMQPLVGHRCPLAPQLYRQQAVCETEEVPFESLIELMEARIRSFEPVVGSVTHVLLDSWYCAKCLWRAARERDFQITTGIKSNRWLRVDAPTDPRGWRWQRLSDYAGQLEASDYVELSWPRGEGKVYVHVVTTRVRKLYRCQVVIVRHSLDAPLSQTRSWASSDLEADAQTLLSHIAAR